MKKVYSHMPKSPATHLGFGHSDDEATGHPGSGAI